MRAFRSKWAARIARLRRTKGNAWVKHKLSMYKRFIRSQIRRRLIKQMRLRRRRHRRTRRPRRPRRRRPRRRRRGRRGRRRGRYLEEESQEVAEDQPEDSYKLRGKWARRLARWKRLHALHKARLAR